MMTRRDWEGVSEWSKFVAVMIALFGIWYCLCKKKR